MMSHRYHIIHASDDGDFIVWESLCLEGDYKTYGRWIEHTRWLIPGTQMEED